MPRRRLPTVTLAVLLVATVLLARNRWRAVLLLGIGAVAVMIVARAIVQRVVDEAPAVGADAGARAARESFVGDAAAGLRRLTTLVLVAGLAMTRLASIARDRRRDDLALVGGVLAGVAIVATLGISVAALLGAVVVALTTTVVTRRLT